MRHALRVAAAIAAILVGAMWPTQVAGAAASAGRAAPRRVGRGPRVSALSLPASLSGEVQVSFAGSRVSGCARHGLCGYHGTVVFSPGSAGVLNAVAFGRHYSVQLLLGMGAVVPQTVSIVTLSRGDGASTTCIDSRRQPFVAITAPVAHDQVALGLAGVASASLFETSCAGPLDGDLLGLIAPAHVAIRRLLRGGLALDLAGVHRFAAGGLAGTVVSTLRVALGAPQRQRVQQGTATRVHVLGERLTLVRVGGVERAQISALPGRCTRLGACGLHGTLSWQLRPRRLQGSLLVTAPRRVPYAALRAILHGGRLRGRGVGMFALLQWPSGGELRAQLRQGGLRCSDAVALGGGTVALGVGGGVASGVGGRAAQASLRTLKGAYTPDSLLRTRCPGPILGEVAGGLAPSALGALRVPVAILRRRVFTITVRPRAGQIVLGGYRVRLSGSLSLTLSAGRVRRGAAALGKQLYTATVTTGLGSSSARASAFAFSAPG